MKATKNDLSVIFSNANSTFIKETKPKALDNQEWITLCYLKAIINRLSIDITIDVPTDAEWVRHDD